MTARNLGAPLSAILFSLVLGATITDPAVAAAPINYAMVFYGGWSSSTSYKPGYVVTYNGASYLCLVANSGVTPPSEATDWTILDAPGTLVDANGDIAEGAGALSRNTGGNNTGFGNAALNINTTGSYNTASGVYALGFNTTGSGNTASAYLALRSNATGTTNTASGIHASLGCNA